MGYLGVLTMRREDVTLCLACKGRVIMTLSCCVSVLVSKLLDLVFSWPLQAGCWQPAFGRELHAKFKGVLQGLLCWAACHLTLISWQGA